MEQKPKIAIVAPCHIPPSEAWVHALKSEADAHEAQVIIVDDSNGQLGVLPESFDVYPYEAQEDFLGELYPEFARLFHKSSACRIFGHLVAMKMNYDIVIGLDSDCIVERHFIRDHIQFLGKDYGSGWFNPLPYGLHPRGYPYSQRNWPVVANMGLWKNVLDINGKDRKSNDPKEVKIVGSTVPSGPFPFSGMNFAVQKDFLPFFLFLPNFTYTYDDVVNNFRRIDDVWGGYIFQKFLRILKASTMVGYPFVFHDTIVIPEEDAAEEAAMYEFEDLFYESVDKAFDRALPNLDRQNFFDAFEVFANEFKRSSALFEGLFPALDFWVKAIKKYG